MTQKHSGTSNAEKARKKVFKLSKKDLLLIEEVVQWQPESGRLVRKAVTEWQHEQEEHNKRVAEASEKLRAAIEDGETT